MESKVALRKINILSKTITDLSSYESINGINKGGIYSIWWTGSKYKLKRLNRNIKFQGKQITIKERSQNLIEETVRYHIHKDKWDWNLDTNPVCLYVGKTQNINNRIKQHLELRQLSENWYHPYKIRRSKAWHDKYPDSNDDFLIKRTSGCQVRAGIEHLFKNQPHSSIEQKLKYFGISILHEGHFRERFYLEDLAIGYYRPWFNLDGER